MGPIFRPPNFYKQVPRIRCVTSQKSESSSTYFFPPFILREYIPHRVDIWYTAPATITSSLAVLQEPRHTAAAGSRTVASAALITKAVRFLETFLQRSENLTVNRHI
jgi:hypothetical protein